MNNFWTVGIDADGKVFLENEKVRDIKLYVEGKEFKSVDEKALFASKLARSINGTLNDSIG
jgi:hypothetical protein